MVREFKYFDQALIADLIHDKFFDIEDISIDDGNHQLKLFYYADDSLTAIEGKIIVENVIKVKIVDTEKVKYYDINYIQWVDKEKKNKIVTNIPLLFDVYVAEFEIKIMRLIPSLTRQD